MTGTITSARIIWRFEGPDALKFLQGMVSNDVMPLGGQPGLVWAALLTPQGKYLADLFIARRHDDKADVYLVDLPAELGPDILRRLLLYKLRANVEIGESGLYVQRGTGAAPEGALPDPRHPALGWRLYADVSGLPDGTDWDSIRIQHIIPEYPHELRPNDSFILEHGFERLNGVSFRKGCYVGQEVTARMKHKATLRKQLVRVRLAGQASPGTAITLPDGREVGILGTTSGQMALAHLRLDRANEPLVVGEVAVTPLL